MLASIRSPRTREYPLRDWDRLLATLPGAGPYQTAHWGQMIATHLGGEMRVFELDGWGDTLYIPVLIGGPMAPNGFCCGHVGYGGVFSSERGLALTGEEQLEALHRLSDELGLPCRRYVSAPGTPPTAGSEARATVITPVPSDTDALWKQYSSNARNTIRKARKHPLRLGPLRNEDVPAAVALIHATQERVGSHYTSPKALIAAMIESSEEHCLALGCWLDGHLIATSIFLTFATSVTYLFNGWEREHASLSANYLLIHEASEHACREQKATIDMGYSHSPGLKSAKLRWGGKEVPFHFNPLHAEDR